MITSKRLRAIGECLIIATWFIPGYSVIAQEVIPTPGVRAPSFSIGRMGSNDDTPVTLESLKGQVVLLEFWATWCGPCRTTTKDLISLNDQFAANGLRIVAVTDEDRTVVSEYVKKHPVPYTIGLDLKGDMHATYGVKGIPHAFLLDRNGTVRWAGDPRSLTSKAISEFIASGELPAPLRRSTSKTAADRAEPILLIRLSRSRQRAPDATGYSTGLSKRAIQFQCEAKPLHGIIQTLLELSEPRLESDADACAELFDVEFAYAPIDGTPPSFAPLLSAIEKEVGLSIQQGTEVREVWLMTAQNAKRLPRDDEDASEHEQLIAARKYDGRCITINKLVRAIENRYHVLVEDKSDLTGRTSVTLDLSMDFEGFRSQLLEKYGLQLSKAKATTKLVRVSASTANQR